MFAATMRSMAGAEQRPEGVLIQRVMQQRGLSASRVARLAGISPERWRQITNGYEAAGRGQRVEVIAPAGTLAKMAHAIGISPEQLEEAGRTDAAQVLRDLQQVQPQPVTSLDVSVLRAIANSPDRPEHLRRIAEGLIPMVEMVLAEEEEFRQRRGKAG